MRVRMVAALMIASIALLTLTPLGAAQARPSVTDLVSFLDSTFSAREAAVLSGNSDYLGAYMAGSVAQGVEQERLSAWRDYQSKTNTRIISMDATCYFQANEVEGGTAHLTVYVWTSFYWTDSSGIVIRSGMGVPHDMTLRLIDGSWSIVSDVFDEGPLTGVKSPQLVTTNDGREPLIADAGIVPTGDPGSTYYNRNAAANYSDQYVDHRAYGTNYPSAYNNAVYKDYTSGGGDCTNFVSQCLRAGGAYFVGQYSNPSSTSVWWYNDNGTTPNHTSDDSASYSWFNCVYQRPFVLAGWGTQVSSSQLQRGDIVYYDWTGNGTWDHAAIVAAFDGSGKPLVNCHTNDYYHVRWNFGDTSCKYDCVHIKNYI